MTTDLFAKCKPSFIFLPIDRRDELFKALKTVFYLETGENLPVYGVVRILINNNIFILAFCKTERL